jgi:outer membrane receptor protein involved in Fe transport
MLAVRERLVILLLPFALHAQAPTAELRIEVQDPSGATVMVSGRLENLATGLDRRFETDEAGRAVLTGLPLGLYRLSIAKTGFSTYTSEIDLQTPAAQSRTIMLSVSPGAQAITVVAAAPLAGVDRTLEEIPAPVQSAGQADIQNSGALDISTFLNRRLDAVHINEVQGNPIQADLNYRGYTASPLLGTPQGVSVYMDGVRLNQPFGDVVSWDLIPRFAIAETTLVPGSNPLFGLNTLGGAVALQTKDGRDNPGLEISLAGGSFARKTAELEYGGSSRGGLSWYLGSALFFEDGWRERSPSNARQYFGKLGWQNSRTDLHLSLGYANNLLTGNGLQEQRFLAKDYSSVYTFADSTSNQSPLAILSARHSISPWLTFSGNTYYRYIRTSTFNGDLNENSLDQAIYQPSAADIRALTAAGYSGFPTSGATAANTPFPYWRCIAQALEQAEPAEKCNGLLNRTLGEQHNGGLSGQLTWFASPNAGSGAWRNQFTAGAAYDRSSVAFQQSQQFAYMNPDRTFTPVNAFADGSTNADGEPYDTRVNLDGSIRTASVFAIDTLSIHSWHFTASGRYNGTTVDNRDALHAVNEPGSLTANHFFGRFNPAAGATYAASRLVNFYAGYSEGSRAPTSIELGCADANQPCKLPNAMAGDPPLHQVVTRTVEAGLRGNFENYSWSAGWFRATNSDDILFVASTQTGFGYFKNFGRTLRQGMETSISGRLRRITFGGGYTFLNATYESAETVSGAGNSSNDAGQGLDGEIQIRPGAHIPLIPQHMFKTYADVQAASKLTVSANLIALSSAYARGNENNRHQPDGVYYLGPGESPAYAVVNLGARYRIHPRAELSVQIDNLLNRHYYTAAQLLPTAFTAQGTFIARPLPAVAGNYPLVHATFYAPGAPMGVWGGLRLRF